MDEAGSVNGRLDGFEPSNDRSIRSPAVSLLERSIRGGVVLKLKF